MTRTDTLDSIVARLAYLASGVSRAGYRVFPPSSGRPPESPPKEYHEVAIHDCRPISQGLSLDGAGFVVAQNASAVAEFYDEARVRERYLQEVESVVREATGALAVIAFDHNVRSAKGSAEGRMGVRAPVDMAHNDYTEESGPRRVREIREVAVRSDLGQGWSDAWPPWRVIGRSGLIAGRLVWGMVWPRNGGGRWIYQKFVDYADDGDPKPVS